MLNGITADEIDNAILSSIDYLISASHGKRPSIDFQELVKKLNMINCIDEFKHYVINLSDENMIVFRFYGEKQEIIDIKLTQDATVYIDKKNSIPAEEMAIMILKKCYEHNNRFEKEINQAFEIITFGNYLGISNIVKLQRAFDYLVLNRYVENIKTFPNNVLKFFVIILLLLLLIMIIKTIYIQIKMYLLFMAEMKK